jgi:predicted transcriptional regulator of viral defense system
MIKLTDLPPKPLMLTSELRAAGVQGREIAAAIDEGRLFKAAPGVVVDLETYIDKDLEPTLACRSTGGVVGLLSASARHGLSDALPPTITMIVPWHVTRPPRGVPTRIFRTRDERALSVGVDVSDFHGLELRLTDPARTIVDLYRVAPEAFRQHAVASLTTYLRDDGDERKLKEYGQIFGVWDKLEPEIEAITETFRRGMKK